MPRHITKLMNFLQHFLLFFFPGNLLATSRPIKCIFSFLIYSHFMHAEKSFQSHLNQVHFGFVVMSLNPRLSRVMEPSRFLVSLPLLVYPSNRSRCSSHILRHMKPRKASCCLHYHTSSGTWLSDFLSVSLSR